MAAKQVEGTPGADLLSMRDFAARMGIAISTARRLCYARTVASVRFNRSILIPATEVDRLIRTHLRSALPTAAPAQEGCDQRP
jgi:hypothetical protein